LGFAKMDSSVSAEMLQILTQQMLGIFVRIITAYAFNQNYYVISAD